MIDDEAKDESQVRLATTPRPMPNEVYRHYKGGIYSIIATAIEEATGVPVVVYHSNQRGTNWTRPLSVFTETVVVDGVEQGRFVRVSQ